MRSTLIALIAAFWCAASAHAAHTQASLILSSESAKPGSTVIAGIRLRMDPGWHTYWKYHGASGISTSNTWQLPPGVTAGEMLWPVPEKFPPDDLATYVYENEVVLLVPLKLAADLKPGPLELKSHVTWLECQEQCVPGSADLHATLTVADEAKPSTDAGLIQAGERKLPQPADSLAPRAWWDGPAKGDSRYLIIEWTSAIAATNTDFFPQDSEQFEVEGATERLASDAGHIRLRKEVKKFQGDWPKQITGLIVQKSGNEMTGYDATLAVASGTNSAAIPQSLGWIFLCAFFGGLILNIMPCVLPVIALKILGFVTDAQKDPRHLRALGFLYALGVLASFLALAGLVIGLKAAGHHAGWGMQFASPEFLVILTALVTLVALNLFGIFEVNLGGGAMNAAGKLASRHGAAGAFFNGVLATILATPCTAPFLSVAVGFAFAPNVSYVILALVFLTIGAGLAAPYVILSCVPAALKWLPRPGPWMTRFKTAMGFPMLAVAFWLISLTRIHYGERTWWLAIFLLDLAFGAWLFGEFVQRGRSRRGLAAAVALICWVSGYFFVLEQNLQWRSPQTPDSAQNASASAPSGIAWQRWSPDAITSARAQGRPVLVDFTAQWCLTCNTIVKPALESEAVQQALAKANALPLIADYTRFPPEMTQELGKFGRAGVPLVLIYPKNPNADPIVLPDPSPLRLPSHYGRIVADTLARAAD